MCGGLKSGEGLCGFWIIFVCKYETMSSIDATQAVYPGIAIRMPGGDMTDEQFYQFCMLNPDLRIERTAGKVIVIMPPTNSDTGNRNAELIVEIGIWNRKNKSGKIFDSSTGFKLPDGAEVSPDVSWIANAAWDAVSQEHKQRFAPITPDFVVEIRSGDQSLNYLKNKMEVYMSCGCRLAWLIDPKSRKTWVYYANGDIQTVSFGSMLDGADVLPGFEIRLSDIFES